MVQLPLLAHIAGDRFITFRRQMLHRTQCRQDADLMLHAVSAKHAQYSDLHFITIVFYAANDFSD